MTWLLPCRSPTLWALIQPLLSSTLLYLGFCLYFATRPGLWRCANPSPLSIVAKVPKNPMSLISTEMTWEFYKSGWGGEEGYETPICFPIAKSWNAKEKKNRIQGNDSFSWLVQHSSRVPHLHILLFSLPLQKHIVNVLIGQIMERTLVWKSGSLSSGLSCVSV